MKKRLLFASLFVAALSTAQESTAERTQTSAIRFGATANVHHSSIKGIHDYSKGRTAAGIGAFVQIPLNIKKSTEEKENQLFIQPQLEYTMDGEKAKPEGKETQKFYYDYLSLPIFVKYYFDFNKDAAENNWFAAIGPQFGYAVNTKTEGNLYTLQDVLAEKSLNKFNFGLVVSGGYRINNDFEAFIRYDQGLTKVYKDYTASKTWNYKLGLGVNYFF